MSTFIRLINLTEQGAKNINELPKLIELAQSVMKKHKTKVVNLYTTLGNYDLVAIIEAPNCMADAKVNAELASQGNFRDETLPAVTIEEFIEGGTEEEY